MARRDRSADGFERDLTAAGCVVHSVEGLHELYLGPPLDIDGLLPRKERS